MGLNINQAFELAKAPFGLAFAFFTVVTYYRYYIFGELFVHLTKKQTDFLYEQAGINKTTALFALIWLLISVGSAVTKPLNRNRY